MEPDNCFEVLSKRCHKLKSLHLTLVNCLGLDKLLKVNRNLVSVNLYLNDDSSTSETFVGDILEILGQCCFLLQNCFLQYSKFHATDIQIDTFTKGCMNLKSLRIDIYESGSNVYHKLLHSLGRYNSTLEEIKLHDRRYENDENNDSFTSEQSIYLQSLTNGCQLLHTLTLEGFKNISTSDISYLLNHATKLQKLNLDLSQVCQDGGVIAKDEGKLKYLERLDFFNNPHITDESIINVVKGCHNLLFIDIQNCSKLTDTCLFRIAENCPNLKTIVLDFGSSSGITLLGLLELLKKCLKLNAIDSSEDQLEDIPDIIVNQLKERQNK